MGSISRTKRLLSAALGLSMLAGGCRTQTEPETQQEPFSLGGKADGSCPASSTLCWSGDDVEIARQMLELKDDVVFGYEPKQALFALIEHANYLEHKLTDEQLGALDAVSERIEQLPDGDFELPAIEVDESGEVVAELPPGHYRDGVEVLAQLEAKVTGDLLGAYLAANMVPLGQFTESSLEGKLDEAGIGEAQDLSDFGGTTPDMQHSLELLYDSGLVGAAMVTVFRATGVLHRDYEVINAENFGEVLDEDGRIRPFGLTREARVRRIIRKYTAASAAVGAGAGLVALVPIAGTVLSISAETFLQLKLQAQMAFEIGAVHGWDIREGDNLYLLSMLLLGDGLAGDSTDVAIFISNFVVPTLLTRLAGRFGVTITRDLARTLATRSIGLVVDFFRREAHQQLTEAALEGTVRGIGGTVLGWATLGASVVVSAGFDAAVTYRRGQAMQMVSKRWLTDVTLEAGTYMADGEGRDCAFRAMAAMAWRDAEIAEEEKDLFVAFLAKPYALDEQTWVLLAPDEVVRQAQMVGAWAEADSLTNTRRCMERQFQGSSSDDRVSLLGHMYSMALIDGGSDSEELELYQEYRDGLDGSGWFDGAKIDEGELEYVERALNLTANPAIVVRELAEEHAELGDQLLPGDVFEFLEAPNPTIRGQFDEGFDCGRAGGC